MNQQRLSYTNPDFSDSFCIEKDYYTVWTKIDMAQEVFDFFDQDQDTFWCFDESLQCHFRFAYNYIALIHVVLDIEKQLCHIRPLDLEKISETFWEATFEIVIQSLFKKPLAYCINICKDLRHDHT